jgi:hypothetical protein
MYLDKFLIIIIFLLFSIDKIIAKNLIILVIYCQMYDINLTMHKAQLKYIQIIDLNDGCDEQI